MAYRPRRNYRKRVLARNTKFVKRKSTRKNKTQSIVSIVNKVLARKVETKVLQYSGSLVPRSINTVTSQVQFDASAMFITPQGASIAGITQGYPILGNGIGQDQRIGDRVHIKGQYLDYLLTALDYDSTFNPVPKPQIVTVWIVKPKVRAISGLDVTKIQSGASANFYENQANNDSGMTGTLVDLLRKPDKDNFQIIYAKQHKIGWSGNLSNTNVAGTFQNNDFKSYYRGRIKLKGGTWKVSRQEEPQTQPVFCFVTCMPSDGYTQSSAVWPVGFDFNLTTYYTDM